jgi:hypothetical protein
MFFPKIQKVGTYSISGNTLVGGVFNDKKLDNLRPRNDAGVGVLIELEIVAAMTVGTLASDPAIPSYMLDRLLDIELVGVSNHKHLSALGYHMPVREVLREGRFIGTIPQDIPATGGGGPGSYTRTVTRRIKFYEPRPDSQLAFVRPLDQFMPCAAFRDGLLRIKPYTTANPVNAASPKLTDVTVTVYAKILDFPINAVPIGIMVESGYAAGLTSSGGQRPQPGGAHYKNLAISLDPATASIKDDLGALTNIDFGLSGGFSVVQDRDVSEYMRQWNAKYSRDPYPYEFSVTKSEQFRFLDANYNASGRLHAIPLVTPEPAQNVSAADLPDFSGTTPSLRNNYDVAAGVPATMDFLWDRIIKRDAQRHVQEAINKVAGDAGQTFARLSAGGKIRPLRATADATKVPLIVDMR